MASLRASHTTLAVALTLLSLSLVQVAVAQRDAGDAQLERGPVAGSDYEAKVLNILEGILQNQRFRNVPVYDGRLLRILAETSNARHVVEIGTSTGYSGIWFGLALKKTGGRLTTYEIDAERARVARENFKKAEMDHIITVIEGDAHEEVARLQEPIDILFLDADKAGYLDYFNKLLPLVRPHGLIIAHNITPQMADPQFVEAISTNPDLETIVRGGVSITLKKK